MDFLVKIVELFDSKMVEPTSFTWFHNLSIILVVLATVFLCKRFGNAPEEQARKILLYVWCAMVTLEIYKQLNFGISYGDGTLSWDYAWYAFPYQFCSSPLYALPVIIFMKDGRVRDAFIGFMTFFSLFAGLTVLVYPEDALIDVIGINIQTMFHHGMQIVLGIFLAYRNYKKFSLQYFLHSVAVFAGFVIIAILLNVIVYNAFVATGIDETFNMFFISPYFDCSLPVLSMVYDAIPYPVFLIVYIVGFAVVAFLMYLIIKGIELLSKKCAMLHAH